MTVLTALTGYYDRLAARDEVPPYGYSSEQISFALIIGRNGTPIEFYPLQEVDGGKSRPKRIIVPQTERSSDIKPKFLWDNTSYVFGVSDKSKRPEQEHAAFKEFHERLLIESHDEGLRAFLAFLRDWEPTRYVTIRGHDDALDSNVVFRLDGEHRFLHERKAAEEIWHSELTAQSGQQCFCLVSGRRGAIAETHPKIKGVRDAQTAGAAIVSFNDPAYQSYGKEQGANAPVSERAAFGYTSALNKLLERESRNRVQIADATTVFWAEAADTGEAAAEAAEGLFDTLINLPAPDDAQEAAKVRDAMAKIERGQPLQEVDVKLKEGTRFYVLGLSPNAARLSIRFWYEGTLGDLARRFREHWNALTIEPTPWRTAPAIWRLLYETAAQRKAENISPLLAGELMRAILTGGPYPRALLSAVVMRLRADRDVNGMRAAICKACLIRNREDVPVSLDRNEPNPGYRLGRLFAVLEAAQRAALGKVNASIRDRYYGAASATPASIFPVLLRNAGHHLSNLRKDKGGLAHWFEKEIGEIVDGLDSKLPHNLRIEDQGRFAVGYYHQRFTKRADAPGDLNEISPENGGED